ncbi:MAG: GIY-YIG nuclease family protein [bacterium]
MASVLKIGGRFRAQVRRKVGGRTCRLTKTFSTEAEAVSWSEQVEDSILAGSVGEGLMPSPKYVLKLPRHNPTTAARGIYFLIKDDRCVYVGQSKNVHVRVREHRTRNSAFKDFDSYSYLSIPDGDLDEVEAYYIRELKPVLNMAFNPMRSKSARSSASVAHFSRASR